jgi:hypothetical protein
VQFGPNEWLVEELYEQFLATSAPRRDIPAGCSPLAPVVYSPDS